MFIEYFFYLFALKLVKIEDQIKILELVFQKQHILF